VGRQPKKPKYVYRVTRRNKRRGDAVYWYNAPPGLPRVPVPYPFMSPEFVAFADARNKLAIQTMTPATPGTFKHLADLYRGVPVWGIAPSKKQQQTDPIRYAVGHPQQIEPSQDWMNLEPRTRTDYTRYVDEVLGMWGEELVLDLEIEMVEEAMAARRQTPRGANYLANVLSTMLAIALRRKRIFGISENVCSNVKRFGVKSGVKARNAYWTYEDEKRFLADADETDPVIALGARLLAFTGQRPGDVRKMMLADYDGETIRVIQSKTKARVWVKCHKALKPHLDKAISEAKMDAVINASFLRGQRGAPMGERYFATRWDEIAARTGTKHLNRQDLRRTAVVRLAEAGCTTPQIASITGHSLRQVETILETYFVRTYEMGEAAIEKLEAYQDKIQEKGAKEDRN